MSLPHTKKLPGICGDLLHKHFIFSIMTQH
jgi:hypothetical protein